jgi:hypothetical protein
MHEEVSFVQQEDGIADIAILSFCALESVAKMRNSVIFTKAQGQGC